MRRIITCIMVIAFTIPSFAQYETNKSRSRYNRDDTERYYGLRLGMNIASTSSESTEFDTNPRTGLVIGFAYGMQLSRNMPLWLEVGLQYSEKGGKTHLNDDKVTYRLGYLQAPIVAKYVFNIDDDLYIQPFFGGYLSLGITGKMKNYATRESESVFDNMKRFDGGLRGGCGLEYKMMYVELGYDLGLANISKDDFDSAHTRCLFVNLGINF
ncbi:MAG: PorT family protein [Prevotella sp.]|nr:PorT family protein [Prevotella sp.]MBQ8152748.1 PorT family protein [Prevotella sp.]MBQ8714790.1 PorT family protein [Prevotella sp.]